MEPLSAQEYESYLSGLRTADFWEDLTLEKKETCFQAEVVEGMTNGRIPVAPRTRSLVIDEMMVDGVMIRVMRDSGASVCLIPRKIFLDLVDKKGTDYYTGKVAKTSLRIRGVTNHLLDSGQEVMLRMDTGVTIVDVPCLIDERVEVEGESPFPLLLGLNGLQSLGYVLVSPAGEPLMTPMYHQLKWKIVDDQGHVLYDGRPMCNPLGLDSPEESIRNRKKNPEVPDEPIPVYSPTAEAPEDEGRDVEVSKEASKHLFPPRPKKKPPSWQSQPKKVPIKKKKGNSTPSRSKLPITPSEAARRLARRAALDQRKGPVKASPTSKRRTKKEKSPFSWIPVTPSGKRRRNSNGIIPSSVISVLSGPQLQKSSALDGPGLRLLCPHLGINSLPRKEFFATGRTNQDPHPTPSGSMSLGSFPLIPIQTKNVVSLPSFGYRQFLILRNLPFRLPLKPKM